MLVVWTKRATSHLNHIYNYCKANSGSEAIASALYNRILDVSDTLKTFPMAGKRAELLPESPNKYYSFVVEKHYKIIYYIDGQKIFIMAVFDCRRDPEAMKDVVYSL